ncbi:MAG: phosphatase PAP2 family protein [candidate division Zixibacteria bacterium]|nr:phosphatase PAP2 family protein [candidate division Zixibacteria bacterium]
MVAKKTKMNKKPLFLPVDWVTIIYLLALSFIILLFHHVQPPWYYYLIFNFSIIFLVLAIVYYLSSPEKKLAIFFRHWYPIFLFTFLYEETRYLVHLIFPGFFDSWINYLELAILGNYPTIFLERFSFPILNEYFLMAYFSYYFILPILGIALYFRGKLKEFDSLVLASAISFYISYLGFIFFPVEGPRCALASLHQTPIKGFIFAPLAQWVVKVAGLHGGCMPSSHVAVTMVVFVFAYKYTRRLFYFLGPLILSLFIGTIWGRFHYISDVIAGILVGIFSLYLAKRIEKDRKRKKQQYTIQEKDFSLDLVRSE